MKIMTLVLLVARVACGQSWIERALLDPPGKPVPKARYIAASAAHAAGHYLDLTSTRDFTRAGWCEANPLFRAPGEPCKADIGRVIGAKTGIVVGVEAAKFFVVRKWPRMARPFDILGFSAGVAYGGIAARNWSGRVPYRFGVRVGP